MNTQARIATAALAAALIGVLTSSANALEPTPTQRPSAPAPGFSLLDPIQPESLLEVPPLNQTARDLAKGRRTLAFCIGLSTLSDLAEPDPNDLVAMINFAARYRGYLSTIELSIELPEDRQGVRKRVPLPRELSDAILQEQAQMNAFMTRLTFIRASADALRSPRSDQRVHVDGAQAERLIKQARDTVFLQLVNSSFSTAERTLDAASTKFCT